MLKKFMLSLLMGLMVGVVSAAPSFGGSAAIGTVAGSLNATVAGQALLPDTTLFSGDQLRVTDGAVVIALTNGSRITLGSATQAQFLKEAKEVSVALTRGNLSMYHPAAGSELAVNAERWSITPGKGYKTVGEVALLNGAVVVTAKDGLLHVVGHGRTIDVAKGKTITLLPRTAAMPQTGTSQKLIGSNTALEAGAVGAGGLAAILSGVAISRAGSARNAANAAKTNAAAATSAANAATSAANAATSAAKAAGTAANAAGCALNIDANRIKQPSPYTPPAGFKCPSPAKSKKK